ncbi:hypothetical protein S40285_01986 [Stachybotrys chlorohalonatus IBT 40285]|uniref:Uncharacterized protein n=1 Tax=Stachybotrys chlorohalonatus (strain IBT 40285) TaxID=1283841 RepID=A0A084QIH0_STAC4|nr:hypothetical protein S40285_01986 [Stachybotrys chlorohalonata IBT 40285]
MMLTVKQPPSYGYKSVHDLPTPPSTSRASPPLLHLEATQKSFSAIPRSRSPTSQAMSGPHRGLPPPAAMALPPQQPGPPAASVAPPSSLPLPPPPPPTHHSQPPSSIPQSHQHQGQQSWTALPAPPQQWQGAEDAMRNWLQTRAEEEKTRQEEEKTRQESLRLEQRKIEMDMLRASLSGGIPPPMVPLVFAGMSSNGVLPQAALDWAQQFMQSAQLPPTQQNQHATDHLRDGPSQAHGRYSGPAWPSSSAQGSGTFNPYPGSPTRGRGHTVSGVVGSRGLGTSCVCSIKPTRTLAYASAPYTAGNQPVHLLSPLAAANVAGRAQLEPAGHTLWFVQNQEKAKRRTAGSQQLAEGPVQIRSWESQRTGQHGGQGNASPSRTTHKRQRSDFSLYQGSGQSPRSGTEPGLQVVSPGFRAVAASAYRNKEDDGSRKQSVTSLLSSEASEATPAALGR